MTAREDALSDIDAVLCIHIDGSGKRGNSFYASQFQACIERWAPKGSSYLTMAAKIPRFVGDAEVWAAVHLEGILTALRRDYAARAVTTFEQIVHAEMFDDLLQQAQYLLDGGYLLAAAVLAGATFEEHLRKLAAKNAITLVKANGKPKTASEINDDLHKATAYPQPQWRQNQVWIDLRNEAAHNNPGFAARTDKDVGALVNGVREIIVRYPA